MPMHPPPPSDLAGLVDAFRHTVQTVIDLGRTCAPDDFTRHTERAGWTVKDHITDIAALESWLAGEQPRGDGAPEVRTDLGAFLEAFVTECQAVDGADVVSELEDLLASRMSALRDPGLAEDSLVRGVSGGPMPAAEAVRSRACDVWVHEQDIRGALGRPGNLDSPAATLFVRAVIDALPRIVAEEAKVPVGYAVILDVTGPTVARSGARVVQGPHHQPIGEKLFTGGSHDVDTASAPVETTSVSLSTDALTRRAAGRRDVDEISFSVRGDEEIARAVLDRLLLTT